MSTKLLDTVDSPADLKKLPIEKLPQLAEEIREFMIETISHTGGHLASSLGVIELTIALHYCYDTPDDKLVWDVGHQAYAHKILTGRKDRFNTIRQYGGLSGFPRLSESEYDALSAGHASTSISAALGMAAGRDVQKQKHSVVAVIGDGSLGGGLALEGLNNLGSMATNMTVVLNDNEMSISKNVGALSRYLTRVLTDKRYNKIKSEIWELLGGSNVGKSIRGIVSNLDYTIKNILVPGKLFEDMGLRYLGPIDGHNIAEMIEVFRSIRNFSPIPTLVHVITKKGKGYGFAENDATKYHGIGSFSKLTGDVIKKPGQVSSYSDVFGKTIVEMASSRPDLVAITAAMRDGTKLTEFSKTYPDRFFDVGIAEQHAVTFAAGLALKGLRPVVALYSTFLQRAFDQVIHDVALDNLHVIFCIDRAGLVGDDGPTHHGAFDISFLRSIPGVTIMAPRDVNQLRKMMYTAVDCLKGPVFIRYPKAGIEGTGI
ncbi:MAG TPA: 1-deoxy-D-xylulose-5-phosphate synthase, partial [Chitinispirillaceae bacterium]|nr:1-deoxy-D-xylulose-5-phosphate synthase [Chitinispirillaceae bacterium]